MAFSAVRRCVAAASITAARFFRVISLPPRLRERAMRRRCGELSALGAPRRAAADSLRRRGSPHSVKSVRGLHRQPSWLRRSTRRRMCEHARGEGRAAHAAPPQPPRSARGKACRKRKAKAEPRSPSLSHTPRVGGMRRHTPCKTCSKKGWGGGGGRPAVGPPAAPPRNPASRRALTEERNAFPRAGEKKNRGHTSLGEG